MGKSGNPRDCLYDPAYKMGWLWRIEVRHLASTKFRTTGVVVENKITAFPLTTFISVQIYYNVPLEQQSNFAESWDANLLRHSSRPG